MQFFDGAARTASQDAPLLLELAEGYRRLGNVMGSAFSDNLGRQKEALRAFRKGLALVQTVRWSADADNALLRAYSGLLVEAALAAIGLNRRQEAEDFCRELEQVVTQIETRPGGDGKDLALAAVNWAQLGLLRSSLGHREESIRLHSRSLALFGALPPEQAATPATLSQKAFAHKRLGAMLMSADLAASEENYRKGLEIDRELLRRDPADSTHRYNMTFALSGLGLIAKMRGDDRKSLAYFSEAAAIRDEFHAADPNNVRVLNGVVNVHCQKASVLARLARFQEARSEGSTCEKLARRLAAIEGERGCGRGPAAMLSAAEAPPCGRRSRRPAPAARGSPPRPASSSPARNAKTRPAPSRSPALPRSSRKSNSSSPTPTPPSGRSHGGPIFPGRRPQRLHAGTDTNDPIFPGTADHNAFRSR